MVLSIMTPAPLHKKSGLQQPRLRMTRPLKYTSTTEFKTSIIYRFKDIFLPSFGGLHPEGEEAVPERVVGRERLGADEST